MGTEWKRKRNMLDDDDDIFSKSVEVVQQRKYSGKCVYIAITFHFIPCSCFELLTLLRCLHTDPSPRSILSRMCELERNRPTTTAPQYPIVEMRFSLSEARKALSIVKDGTSRSG